MNLPEIFQEYFRGEKLESLILVLVSIKLYNYEK
jgi:hypothetical protein